MNRNEIRILVLLAGFLVCLTLPSSPYAPRFLKGPLVAQLLMPMGILLLLRENPLSCGLGPGDVRKGLRWTAVLGVATVLACLVLAQVPELRFYYSPPRWGAGRLDVMVQAEGRRVVQLVGWEFLFRGFLLFPLQGLLGAAGNVVQASLCALAHLHKPGLELYGSFVFALVMGRLALAARSIWYGFLLHWILGFALELFSYLAQRG